MFFDFCKLLDLCKTPIHIILPLTSNTPMYHRAQKTQNFVVNIQLPQQSQPPTSTHTIYSQTTRIAKIKFSIVKKRIGYLSFLEKKPEYDLLSEVSLGGFEVPMGFQAHGISKIASSLRLVGLLSNLYHWNDIVVLCISPPTG